MQRRNPAETVDVRYMDIRDIYNAKTATVSTPPRMEIVTWPEGEPAEAAPSAPAEAETETAAPSPEGDVRRRPERTIPAVHRTRPPSPRTSSPHPATIVIRRPSPGLVPYPRPSVVRLIHPVSVAIRSPLTRLIGIPNVAVIVDVAPLTVGIEILRTGVIAIGVVPGIRVSDDVVAIANPTVPIIAIGSGRNPVLRGIGVSADSRHFAAANFGAALRRRDLRLTLPHDHDRVAIR